MPVVIGAALAGIGYAAFTTAAAFSTMALFSAIMIGASVGSLFLRNDLDDYSNSATYSMGGIHNTMSQNVPIPIIYGGNMRVAGNIIYQAFDSDEKKVQTLYVLLSEGEIESVTDIKANDQLISDLPDCSVTVYKNTTSSTHDSRDPSGTRPYPNNVALLCMTLTASDKLSGSPTITSIVEGVKVWTPSGRIWTTNPIWCAIDLLANPRYGMGLCTYDGSGNYDHPDWDRIDYSYAVEAASICDGYIDGDKRFELTYILDAQKPIKEALQDMLQTCRGYIVENEKIELHIETAVNNVSHAITENNIVQGSFTWWQKTDNDQANQVCLTWTDPNSSYDQVTDVYQNDPDIADRGLVTQNYTMVGITKQTQANRMGYYILKTNLLVRNLCSFRVGIKDIDIKPGQVIAITFTSFTGWSNKWFRVISTKIENETEMTVVCGEYIADCYNDGSIEVTHHIDTQRTKSYTPQEVTNLTITEEINTATDGTYRHIAVLHWTPSTYANSVEVWYRFDSDAYYTMAATLARYSDEYRLDATAHSIVYVKIITVSSVGVRSAGVIASRVLTGDTTAPAAPTNVVATTGYHLCTLTWTDPADSDLDHVNIYRCYTIGGEFVKIGEVKRGMEEYTDNNIYTPWYYKLKAVDTAKNASVWSEMVTADRTPPAVPTNLTGSGGYRLVNVTWTDPADGDLDHIVIYRSSDGVTYNACGQANKGEQLFIDANLAIVTTYWHKVKAVDWLGNESALSSPVSTTTEAIPMPEIPEQSITATKIADGAITTPKLAANCITGNQIAANVQIAIGNGGELLMGTGSILQMAAGVMVLNSETGHFKVTDPNDTVNGDYVDISGGALNMYHKFSGDTAFSRVKTLQNVESFAQTHSVSRIYYDRYVSLPSFNTSNKYIQDPIAIVTGLSMIRNGFIDEFGGVGICTVSRNASTGIVTITPQIKSYELGTTNITVHLTIIVIG